MDVGTDDPSVAEDGVDQPSVGLVSIVNESMILAGDSEDEEDVEVVVRNENVMDQGSRDPNLRAGMSCSECLNAGCSRPVQEACGHMKCRQCFIASEEACKQCVENTATLSLEDTVPEQKCPEQTEEKKETKKVDIGKKAQITFQLEQPSGAKSIVIVSPETLRELGIEEVEFDDEDEDDADNVNGAEDNANHNDEEIDGAIDDGDNANIAGEREGRNGEENSHIDADNKSEDIADQNDEGNSHVVADKESDDIADQNDEEDSHFVADKQSEDIADQNDEEDSHIVADKESEDTANQNDEEQRGQGDSVQQEEIDRLYSTESIPATSTCRSNDHASNDGETMADITAARRTRKGRKKHRVKYDDHIITLTPEGSCREPVFKCLKCNTEYTRKYHRQYHIYCNPMNGRNPFICSHCSKICLNGSHLVYHVRSQHTHERPHECKICKRNFHQKVKLNRHMRIHENNPTPSKKPKVYTKRYLCAYCNKTFNELSICKRHLLTHTEDRPFKCTICTNSNGFKSKAALDSHSKTHNLNRRERPHKCTDCNLTFVAAKDLRRHALQHSGEYPYQCEVCGTKSRRKDNFERHLRNTHQFSEPVRKMMSKEALAKYERSKRISSKKKR